MLQQRKVSFNINNIYGYISYNPVTGDIFVHYPDEKTAAAIKNWLNQEHEINTPTKNGGTTDFSAEKYLAARSARDFETVLTRIWQQMNVHIDWSFPAEYI